MELAQFIKSGMFTIFLSAYQMGYSFNYVLLGEKILV